MGRLEAWDCIDKMKKKTHTKPGNKNNYALTYTINAHPERLTKEDVHKMGKDVGACDAALFASIIYPPDGSISITFTGTDGRTNTRLSDIEAFKVWSMLGNMLAQSDELGDAQREICASYFEVVREAVLEHRRNDPNDPYPNSLN